MGAHGAALLLALAVSTVGCGRGAPKPAARSTEAPAHAAAPVAPALRYPDVEPVFAAHCGGCHDKRRGENAAAQRVFESSSYPFATERPEGLLGDLREMFEARRSVPEGERSQAIAWIDAGALDREGKRPPYR